VEPALFALYFKGYLKRREEAHARAGEQLKQTVE
jgi:hypothetical protein